MADNKKARLQAQSPKDPTRKQLITIVEDAFEEQIEAPKKKKKVQPNSLFQGCEHNGNNSKAVEKNPQNGNETMFQSEKNSKTGNKKTIEGDTMDQDDASSNEEGEDTSELSIESNKKGMSIDMYFKVHVINFKDEEDEENEEEEQDTANIEGSGGQASNEGTKKKTRGKTLCKKTSYH
ncbi:mitotic apparatus protein p62-like [Arachis ipaensis]|uniref:mitotic apparatus protein p62-like n=1 Tax=Arachis ipaensis TaxID=130454 RepID=UPI000A2B4108|nr:mitotic apparatus protein p62-like [Arachis ipaensis]